MGHNTANHSHSEYLHEVVRGREAHTKEVKRPQLKLLSNEELVKYGIKKKLITNGESAMDLALVLSQKDPDLGWFVMQIVENNQKTKRGKSGKNASITGVVDNRYYPNPREYIKRISEKVIDATSEFEIIQTMLGITHKTKQALIEVFSM